MSLTPIDVPGNVAHDETISFTLDREPTAIHIEFITDDDPELNTGDWHVVYGGVDENNENGRFSYRFRESSRDGNTWHVVPPGGTWNGIKFRLWADETPEAAYESELYPTLLYERDLRTLATSAFLAQGYSTQDGQPWWFHGLGNFARFVNGKGLELTAAQTPTGGNNYAGAYGGLRVTELAGYDANKYTAIQFRFGEAAVGVHVGTRAHTGSGVYGTIAIGATTQRIIPGNSPTMDAAFWSSSFGILFSRSVWNDGSNTDLSWLVMAIEAGPYASSTDLGMDQRVRTHSFQRRVAGTSLPPMEHMRPFGTTMDTGTGEGPTFKMGAWASGDGSSKTAYVTHVRVMQRPVPTL